MVHGMGSYRNFIVSFDIFSLWILFLFNWEDIRIRTLFFRFFSSNSTMLCIWFSYGASDFIFSVKSDQPQEFSNQKFFSFENIKSQLAVGRH